MTLYKLVDPDQPARLIPRIIDDSLFASIHGSELIDFKPKMIDQSVEPALSYSMHHTALVAPTDQRNHCTKFSVYQGHVKA